LRCGVVFSYMDPVPVMEIARAPDRRVGVIGLGYVGLPVAVAFARRFAGTVGLDVSAARVDALRRGVDATGEVDEPTLRECGLIVSDDPAVLHGVDFFIVTVPTPIDRDRRPDLEALRAASRTVGRHLQPGAIVVYESTVYPGVTQEVCGPILAEASGLRCGVDFSLGYSPERINPGDREHAFEKITKVVAGQDAATLEIVAACYGAVVQAGIHRAPSIMVAEAAKVIENTQRDLNIALMNELSLIFHRLGIDTQDVLAAAGTKWNFLRFTPGLVGGHCIGVDPYYLTARAEQVGVHPQVILAGRQINDGMGEFVARETVKALIAQRRQVDGARVAVLGVTFKENVPDIRNSRVPDVVRELCEYGVRCSVWDPIADGAEVEREYGFGLCDERELVGADAVVLAVAHTGVAEVAMRLLEDGRTAVCADVKCVLDRARVPKHVRLWRL
jgi:UDP-N-acetyl-D-galactosamine dehydrogenase